jgi:DNA-binding transcriptional regulator LsrR (DeoR family)
MFYRDGMTQEDIAMKMGSSQQNISKMIRDALKKAKKIYLE